VTQPGDTLADLKALLQRGAFQELENRCRLARETGGAQPGTGAIHALALEKLDRIDEAVQALRVETSEYPDMSDAFFHLGRLLLELESEEIAKLAFRKSFEFRYSWGVWPYPGGSTFPKSLVPEAIASLRRCIEIDPARDDARVLLGATLFGDFASRPEAAEMIQNAVKRSGALIDGHFALGKVALWRGALELSAAAFSHVLERDPHYPHISAHLSLVRFAMNPINEIPSDVVVQSVEGHCQIAETLFIVLSNADLPIAVRKALSILVAGYARHLSNLSAGYARDMKTLLASIQLLAAATKLHSDSPEACCGSGELAYRLGNLEIAEMSFQKALEYDPSDQKVAERLNAVSVSMGKEPPYPDLFDRLSVSDYLERGEFHRSNLNLTKAAEAYREGLDVHPGNLELILELSTVLAFHGDHEEALAIAEQGLAKALDDHRFQSHLASLLMRAGRFKEAWPLTESRFKFQRTNSRSDIPDLRRWRGGALAGKGLLIWREEGFGDEIRYASCIPDAIRNIQCERIIFECDSRLQSLFQRSFPSIDVRPEILDDPRHDGADFHLPLLSLPSHFRNSVDDFPDQGKFLVADDERVAKWRRRLAALGDGPKIGLAWRSFNPSWRKRPFSSELAEWEPILKKNGFVFVSLQADDCLDEIKAVEAAFGCTIHVLDDVDIKNDAEEAAAVLSALDTVISCRCWITAFAGALGVPVQCFSAPFNAQMADLPYDPWAPATKFYYRTYEEGWDGCMKQISDVLDKQLTPRQVG